MNPDFAFESQIELGKGVKSKENAPLQETATLSERSAQKVERTKWDIP